MPILPEIALGIRPPQITSPMDSLGKTISIADMVSQLQQRQAQASAEAEMAPLRRAQVAAATQNLAAQQKTLDEKSAIDQAFAKHATYNPEIGDIDYDMNGIGQDLTNTAIPGVGSAAYLIPQAQTQVDTQRSAHRAKGIEEVKQFNDRLALEAVPAENFLGLTPDKKKSAWPELRSNLIRLDPSRGKLLPYDYTTEIIDPKLQELVDMHERTKDVAERLTDAQKKETLGLSTTEGREKEITAQIQQFTTKNGKAPDQETIDAIREGVMQKAGFAGFKITRKTPGRAQFSPPMTGDKLPADAASVKGEPITDRKAGSQYVAVYHNGEVLGYEPFQPKAASPTSASLALAAANGDEKASQALKSLDNLRRSQQSSGLTAETLNMLANQFVTTGQLPNLGMGGKEDREAVLNKAGQIAQGQNIVANSAEYKQLQTSTTALQKSHDAIVAFENTASKNLDNAITAAKKLEDTGSPLLNKPLRTIDRNVLGSAEVSAYDAARQVAVNEIAKVTSNPTLAGQLSDTARKEVSEFLPEEATIQQIMAVAQILKMDMENRRTSLADQIKFNNGRIAGIGKPTASAPTFSPGNPYAPKK